MKSIVFIICVLYVSTFDLSAQTVVSLPELNIMYRNYENVIDFGSKNGDSTNTFECVDCKIEKKNKKWIVTPGTGRELKIRVLSKNGEEIGYYPFRVSSLPSLKLFWGFSDGAFNSIPIGSDEMFLSIRFDESILLKSPKIEICDWKVIIGNDSITGKGNILSKEVKELICQQSTQFVSVKIVVKSKDEDNQITYYSQNFTANNEFSNKKKQLKGKLIIIDKSETNLSLFDYSNPQSFISIISSNFIQSPSFMSQETVKRIETREDINTLIEYKSEKDYSPLIETDKNCLNYGKRKIDENGEYVYSEPKFLKYDLSQIDRILIFEDTVINQLTNEKYIGISQIGLAKKYKGSDKYDIVLTFPYQQFEYMKGFSFTEPRTNQLKLNFGIENENNFIKGIENIVLDEINQLEKLDTNIREYRSDILKNSIHFFPKQNDIYGAEYQYSSEVTIGKHIIEPYFSFLNQDSLMQYFDSVSWIYGDYKIRKMIGSVCYSVDFNVIQLGRDKIVYWLQTNDYKISLVRNVRIIEDFYEPCFVPTQIIYSKNINGNNYPFLAIDLLEVKDSISEFSKVLMMPIPISQLPWKKELVNEKNKSKLIFDLKNNNDIKRLDKLFYLDKANDKPVNLLGVCVDCNQ
jgi:hypothetical protein